MKKLYKFHWSVGRMGDVSAVFVADESEVAAAIGKQAYFGEILGKHSEVQGILGAEDFQIVEADVEFVQKFAELFPYGFGHHPLKYLSEE